MLATSPLNAFTALAWRTGTARHSEFAPLYGVPHSLYHVINIVSILYNCTLLCRIESLIQLGCSFLSSFVQRLGSLGQELQDLPK